MHLSCTNSFNIFLLLIKFEHVYKAPFFLDFFLQYFFFNRYFHNFKLTILLQIMVCHPMVLKACSGMKQPAFYGLPRKLGMEIHWKYYPASSVCTSLKILIFSMQPPEVHGEAFKQNDITYYLSKGSDNETVVKVLTNFLNNNKNIERSNQMVSAINPFKTLSSRELQILHYMLNGFGTKQISETLNLKMNSVST